MEIKEIQSKETWDNFVTQQKTHTFLHSWSWGEFNKAMGEKILRLGVYENSILVTVALLIKVYSKVGNFTFVPHGPIIQDGENKLEILKLLNVEFKKISKRENVNFIRISPIFLKIEENRNLFKQLGYKKAPRYMHAETTWNLDLTQPEDELMMGMRKNTRNLIRRAEKENVEIISGTSSDLVKKFLKLYQTTAQKHKFVPFSKKYIETEIENFKEDNNILVYLAKWQNKVLSSAIIVFYGNSAFYHQGASSLENTKIPAAYFLQWEAIKEAKRRGKAFYNFWGIAENEENKKHPWYGLTFFKKGFGGYKIDYLEAQDLKLNIKYYLNYIYDKYISWKRGV